MAQLPTTLTLEGINIVLGNLGKVTKKIESAISVGLRSAGLFLQHKSQEIVPVYLGPLKASARTKRTGTGLNTDVTVSYGTEYAVKVHEIPNYPNPYGPPVAHGREFNIKHAAEIAAASATIKKGRKKTAEQKYFRLRGENQQWKFLEKPAREFRTEMSKIVLDRVQKDIK